MSGADLPPGIEDITDDELVLDEFGEFMELLALIGSRLAVFEQERDGRIELIYYREGERPTREQIERAFVALH